jgi:nucleoside-diphosphate-sugar epimerase
LKKQNTGTNQLKFLNLGSRKTHKILITGGAGYIGSVLARQAISKGFNVNILDHVEFTGSSNIQNIRFFKGSIADYKIIERSLDEVDFVIHLAGISDGRAGKKNPELTKKINVDCLKQLLKLSRDAGIERFVFASTMGVYGNKYDMPLTEDLPLAPIDPYSQSKAIGEEIIRNEKSNSFFTTVSLRIAMVYGYSPQMRYDFIVNRLTLDALERRRITITGGKQKRPQVYIEDLSNIFLEILFADKNKINGESFNVVGVNPTIEEISSAVCRNLPETKIEKLSARTNEDSFEVDGGKLSRVIKYVQQKSLDAGIDNIINQFNLTNR